MIQLLFYILFYGHTWADYDPCRWVRGSECTNSFTQNKATGQSIPSSAHNITQPGSLGAVDGFGVETIIYDGAEFSIVQGNGRIGAGVSASSSLDTFFGNLPSEREVDYKQRRIAKHRYKDEVYSLGTGLTLIGRKSRLFRLGIGAVWKYHADEGRSLGGGGASFGIGPFHGGVSYYRDHGAIEDSLGLSSYSAHNVRSLNLGLALPYINFDITEYKNELPFASRLRIFSTALSYSQIIFTLARRVEYSQRDEFNRQDNTFYDNSKKWSSFAGIQWKAKKSLLVGLFSNYFNVDDLSLGLTFFF